MLNNEKKYHSSEELKYLLSDLYEKMQNIFKSIISKESGEKVTRIN